MLGFNPSEVCEGGGIGGGGGGFGREDAAFDGEVGEAICPECQVRGDHSGKSTGVELWQIVRQLLKIIMIFCENLRNVLCNIKCGPYFLGKEAQ
ncbi:hypothetical protein QUB10_14600 [Microcoleus sp. B5-D4]|uniref:hypothetical protein n=1 Tax=unclassified Microcoleus TaxID=2642155 RepID=UPI002FCF85A2